MITVMNGTSSTLLSNKLFTYFVLDELLIIKPKKPSAIEPFDTGISFTTTKPNIRTTTTIPFFLNKQNIYLFAHWITLVKQSRQKAGEHKEKENTKKKKVE